MDTTNFRREDWSDLNDACPSCGMTRRELYDQGQMGCARCYQMFQAEVQRALEEIHGAIHHIGKR